MPGKVQSLNRKGCSTGRVVNMVTLQTVGLHDPAHMFNDAAVLLHSGCMCYCSNDDMSQASVPGLGGVGRKLDIPY